MFNFKKLIELFIFIFSFIVRKQTPNDMGESLKITLPRMDALSFNENKNKCILLMRDGHSLSKNLTEEYRITEQGIYKKIKGKWILQPDIVGITFSLEHNE